MELPPDPPTLDYAPPQSAPIIPTKSWVGILGFLIYGALSLIFLASLLFMAYTFLVMKVPLRLYGKPGTVYLILFSLAAWRAIAALRGVMQNRRKP